MTAVRRIGEPSPPMLARDPVVAAALARIELAIAELRAAVAPELAMRTALLAALASEFGVATFTALDTLESVAAKPDGELAGALAPLIGSPAGGLRRLSRRLAKLAGRPAGGFVLVRIGEDRGSALYVTQTAHWPV